MPSATKKYFKSYTDWPLTVLYIAILTAEGARLSPITIIIGPTTTGGNSFNNQLTPNFEIKSATKPYTKEAKKAPSIAVSTLWVLDNTIIGVIKASGNVEKYLKPEQLSKLGSDNILKLLEEKENIVLEETNNSIMNIEEKENKVEDTEDRLTNDIENENIEEVEVTNDKNINISKSNALDLKASID